MNAGQDPGRNVQPPGERTRWRKTRRGGTVVLAAALTLPLGGTAVNAAVTPVVDPRNIEVFPGLDIVGAAGFEGPIVIEVWRDGVKIGTTGAPVQPGPDAEAGTFIEVNHDSSFCWAGSTPDIVPGDQVRVITEDGEDPVGEYVDVARTSNEEPFLTDLDNDGKFNDLVMKGRAQNLDGTGQLDLRLAEAEIVQPAFRDAGVAGWDRRNVRADVTGGLPDADTVFPNRGTGHLSYDAVGPGNEDGTHWTAIWKNMPEPLGELALGGESGMIAWERNGQIGGEGVGMTISQAGDASGGAQGCPPGVSDGVHGTAPNNVNIAAAQAGGDLTISGTSFNASAVNLTIDDADTDAGDTISVPVTLDNPASLEESTQPVAPVKQTWKTTVPISTILQSDLADGDLVISGQFDRVIETSEQRNVEVQVTNPDGSAKLEPAYADDGVTATPDTDPSLYRDDTGALVQATDAAGEPMVDAAGTPVYTRQVREQVTNTVYVHTAAPIGGASHSLLKDLTAPQQPETSFPGGEYVGTQWLSIFAQDEMEETVRYRLGDDAVADPGSGSTAVHGQLAISTTQTLTARSYDRAGNPSPVITEKYTIKAPVAPDAPSALSASAGDGQVELTWAAPAADGGAAISRYVLHVQPGDRTPYTVRVPAGQLSTTINGLTNEMTYTFAVSAVNSAGESELSATTAEVTPTQGVPDAPTIGTVTGGNSRVTVTWSAPADTGASAIMRYQVLAFNSATGAQVGDVRVAGGGSRSLVVTGLANGTAYDFEVQAVNAKGASKSSARSRSVRPAAPDNRAPVLLARVPAPASTSVATGGNLTVRFTEPVVGLSPTTFQLRNAATNALVRATVRFNAVTRTAVLNPAVRLPADARFRVRLTSGVTDGAGNPVKAASWSFVTGAAPRVVGRNPRPNATNVRRAKNLSARLSERVVGVSARSVRIQRAGGARVAAAVSFNRATRRVVINPRKALAPRARYTVTLTQAVRDRAGNRLAPVKWSFRTGRR